MGLTRPLWTLGEIELSGRSLILLGGGLFLMVKATREIYEKVEAEPHDVEGGKGRAAFGWVLLQILLLDIVFSLDSVITAVGMANQVSVMIIAMVLAMLVMLVSAGTVSDFVERHPSVKILALAFLLLIGVMLVAEGVGTHMAKGYVYFAMAFSLLVEMLNLRYKQRRRAPPEGLTHAVERAHGPRHRRGPRDRPRDRAPAGRRRPPGRPPRPRPGPGRGGGARGGPRRDGPRGRRHPERRRSTRPWARSSSAGGGSTCS